MKKLFFTASFFVFVTLTSYAQQKTQMMPRAPHSADETPTLVEVPADDTTQKKTLYMPATSATEDAKKVEAQSNDNSRSTEGTILELKYTSEDQSKGTPSKKGVPK